MLKFDSLFERSSLCYAYFFEGARVSHTSNGSIFIDTVDNKYGLTRDGSVTTLSEMDHREEDTASATLVVKLLAHKFQKRFELFDRDCGGKRILNTLAYYDPVLCKLLNETCSEAKVELYSHNTIDGARCPFSLLHIRPDIYLVLEERISMHGERVLRIVTCMYMKCHTHVLNCVQMVGERHFVLHFDKSVVVFVNHVDTSVAACVFTAHLTNGDVSCELAKRIKNMDVVISNQSLASDIQKARHVMTLVTHALHHQRLASLRGIFDHFLFDIESQNQLFETVVRSLYDLFFSSAVQPHALMAFILVNSGYILPTDETCLQYADQIYELFCAHNIPFEIFVVRRPLPVLRRLARHAIDSVISEADLCAAFEAGFFETPFGRDAPDADTLNLAKAHSRWYDACSSGILALEYARTHYEPAYQFLMGIFLLKHIIACRNITRNLEAIILEFVTGWPVNVTKLF